MNKVKGYRNMANMNQAEMAEAIGVSYRSYCDKESGKIDFKVSELIKIRDLIISKGIQVSLDDLI